MLLRNYDTCEELLRRALLCASATCVASAALRSPPVRRAALRPRTRPAPRRVRQAVAAVGPGGRRRGPRLGHRHRGAQHAHGARVGADPGEDVDDTFEISHGLLSRVGAVGTVVWMQ